MGAECSILGRKLVEIGDRESYDMVAFDKNRYLSRLEMIFYDIMSGGERTYVISASLR